MMCILIAAQPTAKLLLQFNKTHRLRASYRAVVDGKSLIKVQPSNFLKDSSLELALEVVTTKKHRLTSCSLLLIAQSEKKEKCLRECKSVPRYAPWYK